MNKKLIFNKYFAYRVNNKDDLRFSRHASPHGESMFNDFEWRLYDDSTATMVGINRKRYSEINGRCKLINIRKFRMTR